MTTAIFTERPAWKVVMLAAFAAVCAYLLYRNLGLYPNIFADEWYYDKMSRLQEIRESILPSWLYLWLYRGTNACGSRFYDCTHIGNVVFFVAAAPFVYQSARQVTGKAVAAFIALLSMLAPINVYTAYFMPEAMYYFGFCVLSWIALARSHWHPAKYGAATGVVLGLMGLVKVHALFLVPALCLFLLYVCWSAGGRWVARGAQAVAVALACFFAVKLGIGYLIAGDAALNLFGNFYKGAVNAAGARSVLSLLPPSFVSARGHLEALALLLPLPLALILHSVLRPPARGQAGKPALLQLYALLMLGAAVVMTAVYTGSIANPGITVEGMRLHLRYYDFIFPLLWLVAASALGKPASNARPALRWSVAFLMLVLLGLTLTKLPTYAFNPVDSPELYLLNPAGMAGRVVLALDVLVLLLWAWGSALAPRLFLFVALPFSLAFGAEVAIEATDLMRVERPADRAGAFALAHIPAAERGKVTVAGSNVQDLMHLQFQLDEKDSSLMLLQGDEPIEQYLLPMRNKWLLVLGKHPLPANVVPLFQNSEFALLRVNNAHRRLALASLAQPFGHGLISSAEGISHAESWGRWSEGSRVILHFNAPLPRHLQVILRAQAYDVNTELPFTMHVGDKNARFRLGWMPEDVGLAFETDGTQRELVIDVPHPIAPLERGQPDPRKIGIGIAEIEIDDTSGGQLANN